MKQAIKTTSDIQNRMSQLLSEFIVAITDPVEKADMTYKMNRACEHIVKLPIGNGLYIFGTATFNLELEWADNDNLLDICIDDMNAVLLTPTAEYRINLDTHLDSMINLLN